MGGKYRNARGRRSVKEVAKTAGVSTSTVRRVEQGGGSKATRRRVGQAVGLSSGRGKNRKG